MAVQRTVGVEGGKSGYDGSAGGAFNTTDKKGLKGGGFADGGGALGPHAKKPEEAADTGPFQDPFQKAFKGPDEQVGFEGALARHDANAENLATRREASSLNFGVDPETGEFKSWGDLENQAIPLGNPDFKAEDGSLANPENSLIENDLAAFSSSAGATLDASLDAEATTGAGNSSSSSSGGGSSGEGTD